MGTAAVCVLCVLRPLQTEQKQAKGPSCTTADYEIEHGTLVLWVLSLSKHKL